MTAKNHPQNWKVSYSLFFSSLISVIDRMYHLLILLDFFSVILHKSNTILVLHWRRFDFFYPLIWNFVFFVTDWLTSPQSQEGKWLSLSLFVVLIKDNDNQINAIRFDSLDTWSFVVSLSVCVCEYLYIILFLFTTTTTRTTFHLFIFMGLTFV